MKAPPFEEQNLEKKSGSDRKEAEGRKIPNLVIAAVSCSFDMYCVAGAGFESTGKLGRSWVEVRCMLQAE